MTTVPPAVQGSDLAPGFADPVRDAQGVFRCLLDAMARPGSIHRLPACPPAPAPLAPAAGAVCLALADLETPLWLDAALQTEAVEAWLRFHSGAPLAEKPDDAVFAVIGDGSGLRHLDRFALGTAEYPDRSTTLIVQVPDMDGGPAVRLKGPGIRDTETLRIKGLPPAFWEAWRANHALFPQGIDVFFVTEREVCGLPRTTHATPVDRED